MWEGLAATELRRSLGQKCGDAFLRICAARHIRDRFVLEFHLLVERIGSGAVEQTFHPSVCARGAMGQFISYRFRLRDQLNVWHYPRDQGQSLQLRALLKFDSSAPVPSYGGDR